MLSQHETLAADGVMGEDRIRRRLMQLRLYTGYFDDFGTRKGIGVTTPAEVEQTLVDLAICGDPILINDGYCFSNEGLWDQLEREARGPGHRPSTILGMMLKTNFAKTLARIVITRSDGTIAGHFKDSFDKMINSKIWPGGRGPQYWAQHAAAQRGALEKLDDRRAHQSYAWPPMDKDEVFMKLWLPAMNAWAPEDVKPLLKGFLDSLPSQKSVTRTAVEQRLISGLSSPRLGQLWDLTNQAYSMTFAACLSQVGGIDETFGLAATFPSFLGGYVDMPASGRRDEPHGRFNFQFDLPIFNAKDQSDLDLLELVMTAGSLLNGLKTRALDMTRDAIDPHGKATVREASDAWRQYAAELRQAKDPGQTVHVRTAPIDGTSCATVACEFDHGQSAVRSLGIRQMTLDAVPATTRHFAMRRPLLLRLRQDRLNAAIDWDTIRRFP
jgi:hypothetical protein